MTHIVIGKVHNIGNRWNVDNIETANSPCPTISGTIIWEKTIFLIQIQKLISLDVGSLWLIAIKLNEIESQRTIRKTTKKYKEYKEIQELNIRHMLGSKIFHPMFCWTLPWAIKLSLRFSENLLSQEINQIKWLTLN